jgi:hypothetical protein
LAENEVRGDGPGAPPGHEAALREVTMSMRGKALGVLLVALGANAQALAQSDGAAGSASLGAGLTLPDARDRSSAQSETEPQLRVGQGGWWSLAGSGRQIEIGVSFVPRAGLQPPPALSRADWPSGVDVGPGLRWRSAAGTLTASYGLDPTGGSRAESVQFSFSRPVISEQGFRMLAFVGATWQSARGDRVIPAETEGWGQPVGVRPLFSAGAATNVGFGLDSYYQLTKSSSITVGASGLRLGGAPADGALYTNRWQAMLYGGYSIRF